MNPVSISDESRTTEETIPLSRRNHKGKNNPTDQIFVGLTKLVITAGLLWAAPASAGNQLVHTPNQARSFGLESLRNAIKQDGGVPLPVGINDYIKNREAALQLGKALFWDMQIGSDGVQSCGSCHYHAGADNRAKNLINPGLLAVFNDNQDPLNGYLNAPKVLNPVFAPIKPNQTVKPEDFPFVKSIQQLNIAANGAIEPGMGNTNEITGSMGIMFTFYNSVVPGVSLDSGSTLSDPIWNNGKTNIRRTVPRNAPSVINAVFNYTNFWDGRANPHFNGIDSFGDQNQNTNIVVNAPPPGQPEQPPALGFADPISLDNASLASQALFPIVSFAEMSYGDPTKTDIVIPNQPDGRTLPEIGMKLLRASAITGKPLIPLGQQIVHPEDSILGSLTRAPFRGLNTTYTDLIKQAFADQYWNASDTDTIDITNNQGVVTTSFKEIEYNFSLFFGLSVALYESTLVADESYFDQWMETGRFNRGFGKEELAGLNLFVNQGQCIKCHAGPELTSASVRAAQGGKNLIRAMPMAKGDALYDNGFYNISVTPTTDDIGRGGGDGFNSAYFPASTDPNGQPLSFSRQSLLSRLDQQFLPFSILGDQFIPAKEDTTGKPVCTDANGNGYCEPNETILPEFRRVAADGAFKTPGLRNSLLTGPYFHNGGMATLRQVVQFYNRGGNFCSFNQGNLDANIQPLNLSEEQEEQLVAFLVSLTDARVVHQKAPFDHPEIRIPSNGLDRIGTEEIRAVGREGSHLPLQTFLELNPYQAIFTPSGNCKQ